MDGWIKLHRKVLQSDVAGDPYGLAVWAWCLLKANHEARKWRGKTIDAGQFLTGRQTAAIETGLPGSTWVGVMRRLEQYGYIRQQSDSRGTLVTVCNYASYQSENSEGRQQTVNEPSAGRQPAVNKPSTNRQRTVTNKNQELRTKNQEQRTTGGPAANPRARFVPPSVEEVQDYCESRGNGIDAQQFIDFYEARGWKLSRGVTMKDWRSAVRTWERRTKPINGSKYSSEEVRFDSR